MQKTLRVYYRDDPRCSRSKQEKVSAKWDGRIIAYESMDELRDHSRKGELVGVAFFHRLGSNAEELRAERAKLTALGLIVLEIDTGRRSDNPHDLGDMVDEARDYYARRALTKAEAKALAAAGGEMSPVTKSRTDRLPNELAEAILNNHATYPTLKLALRAINNATDARGKKFKRKWNEAHVYREQKRGKLNLLVRRSGPKVKR